jgi:hypothetical protein
LRTVSPENIEANYDLLELAIRDSKSGLQRPLRNTKYSPIEGGFVPEQAYEADGIHPKYETIYDPVELFRIHKQIRDGHCREEERKAKEWRDRVEREWYLYERSVSNGYASRLYDKDGRYVTKQWFYENPYACNRNNCYARFKTLDELLPHVRLHGGVMLL